MQQNSNYDDFTCSDFTSNDFNHFTSHSFSPFSIPRAVMAASFAAPLVSKLHWRNIIFHVYGLNPKQETALLTLAMSIWGDPKDFIFRYSDGRDKLSANAEILCHLPMAIRSSHSTTSREARDAEIDFYAMKKELKKKQQKQLQLQLKKQSQELQPQQFQQLKKQLQKQLKQQLQQLELKRSKQWSFIKDRADLVYFLASEYNPWRTSIISTGAKPITYNVYAGCLTGVYTRTIEISPQQTAQTAQTAHTAIATTVATAATAPTDAINTILEVLPIFQNNYGFAGKKFIRFVVNKLKSAGEEKLRADHDKMKAELRSYDSHKGKLNEVAVIALADYYASLSVFAKPAASYSSASYSAIDTDVDTEADKAVDEAVNKAIDVNEADKTADVNKAVDKTADEDKAVDVDEAVAWQEAVQLGRWILINAIDNPVVLK